jgi:hypothetical protein
MIALLALLLVFLVAAAAWLYAERGWFQPTVHQWIVAHTEALLAYAAAMVLVTIPASLLGSVAVFHHLSSSGSPPELELAIAGAESPVIAITNAGRRAAFDVRYTVSAVDLDREPERGGNTFLPLPVQTVDHLQPSPSAWISELFPTAAKPLVANRHRVIGSITLTCGNCSGTRSYSFYLVLGKEGWYWPQPEGLSWATILEPADAAARAASFRSTRPADARRIGDR